MDTRSPKATYAHLTGLLWSFLSGPWLGFLSALASEDHLFLPHFFASLLFFSFSLLLSSRPRKSIFSKFWLLTGISWLFTSWMIVYSMSFQDKSSIWTNVCSTQTVLFILTALPLFLLDIKWSSSFFTLSQLPPSLHLPSSFLQTLVISL